MSAASLTFEVTHTDQSARTGLLKHANGQLETPALLVFTRRGSPLYLTPDMIKHLGPEGQNYILDGTKL
jgi:queuine/archaeosine tRNA-ribosyltransferase